MSRPRAGVLALQGDVAEHRRALLAAGADEVREVRRPADLQDLDALVMPGGESTTIGRLMVEYGLDQAITANVATGLAVLGTCAGLILLSERVLDAPAGLQPLGLLPLTVRRNAYGRQVDSFETGLVAPCVAGDALEAVFIRAPVIEAVGPGVAVLASHGGQPVLCQRGRLLAATFHPELTADHRLHRYFLDLADGAGQ